MDNKGYENFIKNFDERIDNMSDEEFEKFATKLGFVGVVPIIPEEEMTEEDKKGLVINRIGAFSVDGDELSKKMSKVKQLPPINTNGIKYDLPE